MVLINLMLVQLVLVQKQLKQVHGLYLQMKKYYSRWKII